MLPESSVPELTNDWISTTLRPVLHTHNGQFDDCEETHETQSVNFGLGGSNKPQEPIVQNRTSDAKSAFENHESVESPFPYRFVVAGKTEDGIAYFDVLSGRGAGTNKHTGNKYFRELCDQFRSAYAKPKKNMRKMDIAKRIVTMIQERGGRFLKRNDETMQWIEITDREATMKTCQALRDSSTLKKSKQVYIPQKNYEVKSFSQSHSIQTWQHSGPRLSP